ncbi:PREDICTED: uncharacterized protein DDB_G0283357-like [Rhagoletis zephyria]|uniref:uncharacterized protein DDB_G0283357-like n=1 Tax=Rhagoletis zephyria TaxID=28612 RepID=UPI0008118251|nr:PREDICTED: uncharacterized protein DDB_G0283357-like [Rhagoletis zephyria]
MEGRSSDSTYTSSSGGGGSGGGADGGKSASKGSGVGGAAAPNDSNCAGISGRFTRQAVNSRFPAMDRMEMNSNYMRVHKPTTTYNNHQAGMGAYAQLQQQQMNMSSTYPKINYGLPPTQQQQQQHQQQQRRRAQQQQQQRQSQQSSLVQPVVIGTRAMQRSRGFGGGAFAPDNFRSAENSPKEHNSNTALPNNNNKVNNNLDGTYTIYMNTDNDTHTPAALTASRGSQQQQQQPHVHAKTPTATATAATNGRRFVNVENFAKQR